MYIHVYIIIHVYYICINHLARDNGYYFIVIKYEVKRDLDGTSWATMHGMRFTDNIYVYKCI